VIELRLPYPVSANRYWRPINLPNGRHIFVPTKEAKAFKETAGWTAKAAGVIKPMSGRIAIDYTLHPKLPQDWKLRARRDPNGWEDTVQCLDLDNANKVLFDALKGVVFDDDKWVREITARRGEPLAEPCLVVRVSQIVDVPQGTLELA
jgi:crossover junction endodeoxyribonuclease RusA